MEIVERKRGKNKYNKEGGDRHRLHSDRSKNSDKKKKHHHQKHEKDEDENYERHKEHKDNEHDISKIRNLDATRDEGHHKRKKKRKKNRDHDNSISDDGDKKDAVDLNRTKSNWDSPHDNNTALTFQT